MKFFILSKKIFIFFLCESLEFSALSTKKLDFLTKTSLRLVPKIKTSHRRLYFKKKERIFKNKKNLTLSKQ